MTAAPETAHETDCVALLQELIRCKSVTPEEGGALDFLEKMLTANGFVCHRLTFSDKDTPDVENLYARYGDGAPHLCFAGHTDVVPVGDENGWSFDPFGGEIINDEVCGRGAADMKGAIACFTAAALGHIKAGGVKKGSVSFLITGDEEGPGINGTKKVLQWLDGRGEKIDFCLVGEPTSRDMLGDMVKIGRRGTLTGYLTVTGTQGHVAYPHLADNPVPKLVKLLSVLDGLELDKGTTHFQPSNLEIVNIDVGNKATNVIPAQAKAAFNVRFNDSHTGKALEKRLRDALDAAKLDYKLDVTVGGECFYTAPGEFSDMVVKAIKNVTGRDAELSTSGGTSDARFIRDYCPVMEFGIVGQTMHKTDERVAVSDMHALARIYRDILAEWFA
ncbi:MAG: succinyl-diaminopimelate desuccinylase [Alphaproteobacteria bacterium]|nr:succinyl-diaminopimelate desuccinylase [Alphaproteobacteria bacterium]